MSTYLDGILDAHRAVAATDGRRTSDLVEQCRDLPPTRGFVDAIRSSNTLAVIAEVKRRSPSRGPLHADLDPAQVAASYEAGGASCVSVLTDGPHFGGSAEDLASARSAVSLPVLRKDFTVSANDVCDARLMGADCVLLIVAALSDGELEEFAAVAAEVSIDVLVEVHDEAELARALRWAAPTMVGVNQRDLVTFEVDTARAVRVAADMPDGVVRVAESGVRGRDDAVTLAGAGYHAVLVGEHLVTAADLTAATAALRVPRH
ncbi:MAG: indole-3-glycerol phosphate synthase TrpC [Actinomycetes bacterium]